MHIITNIQNNYHQKSSTQPQEQTPQTPQQKILVLLQHFLTITPPKQFNRALRSFVLLYIASLKTIPPNFEDSIIDILATLELLDQAEDEASC